MNHKTRRKINDMKTISEQMEHCEKLAADFNATSKCRPVDASEFFKALYMERIKRGIHLQINRDLRRILPGYPGSQKNPLSFKQIAKRIKT